MPESIQSLHEFFGFRTHPFADTKRLKKPFLTDQDNKFIRTATSLLATGKSFTLYGPSGSGKSTLARYLTGCLDQNSFIPAVVHYSGLQRNGIVKAIADQLGVDTKGRNVPLLIKLQKQIMLMADENRSRFPVFILDDAQLMENESFKDICSLMFNPQKETVAASFIMVGDEILKQKLKLQTLESVSTRLTGQFRLKALEDKESIEFIKFRLAIAKAPESLFTDNAMSVISSLCRGNRRRIMNMATLLIAEAYARQEKFIRSELIYTCSQIDISE